MSACVKEMAWTDAALPTIWSALHAATPDATIFQTHAWMRSWWDAFAGDDPHRRTALLSVVDGSGQVIALAPLYVQRRYVGPFRLWEYLLWMSHELSPYQTLLCPPGREPDAWRAILAWARSQQPPLWFELRDLTESSLRVLVDSVDPRDTVRERGRSTCLTLDLTASTNIDARVAPSLLRNVRKVRAWMQDAPDVHWSHETGMSEEAIARLRTMSRMRFGSSSFLAEAVHVRFLNLLAHRMGDALTLSTLWIGEQPVHVICGLVQGTTYSYFLSGMDPSADAVRPGFANLMMLLEQMQCDGIRCFDFLRGEERYKKEFQPDIHTRLHATVLPHEARMRHAVASALQRLKRGAGS